jgi:hypothetical protein
VILSSSFAFLQSFTQSYLVEGPQSFNSSHELPFPSAHSSNEEPFVANRSVTRRFRLQGLITLLTVLSLRCLAGFVSHRQRSWDSPFGVPPPVRFPLVTKRDDPPTVSPAVSLTAEAISRPDRLRFLGFGPDRRFPRWHVGLAQPPEDTPLGFSLPGFFTKVLARLSPALLSRASPQHPQMLPPAPQSLDQPLLRLSSSLPTIGQARRLRKVLLDKQPS